MPPLPSTFPCRPPPQEREAPMRMKKTAKHAGFRMFLRGTTHSRQASGRDMNPIGKRTAAGVGEVVEMLNATVELPFPAGT